MDRLVKKLIIVVDEDDRVKIYHNNEKITHCREISFKAKASDGELSVRCEVEKLDLNDDGTVKIDEQEMTAMTEKIVLLDI